MKLLCFDSCSAAPQILPTQIYRGSELGLEPSSTQFSPFSGPLWSGRPASSTQPVSTNSALFSETAVVFLKTTTVPGGQVTPTLCVKVHYAS